MVSPKPEKLAQHELGKELNPSTFQYIKNVKGIEPGIHGQTGPNAWQSSNLIKPLGTTIKQAAKFVITLVKTRTIITFEI